MPPNLDAVRRGGKYHQAAGCHGDDVKCKVTIR
jgi:hypothetical protein